MKEETNRQDELEGVFKNHMKRLKIPERKLLWSRLSDPCGGSKSGVNGQLMVSQDHRPVDV